MMIIRNKHITILILILTLLNSCKDSIDQIGTDLNVESVSPNGVVDINSTFEIKFNKSLNQSTINNNIYMSNESEEVFGILEYRIDDSTVVMTLSEPLQPNRNYQLIVTQEVLSEDNNRLSENFILQFKSGTLDIESDLIYHFLLNGNNNDASGNNRSCEAYGGNFVADRFGNIQSSYSFPEENTDYSYIKFPSDISRSEWSYSIWFSSNQNLGKRWLLFNRAYVCDYHSIPLFIEDDRMGYLFGEGDCWELYEQGIYSVTYDTTIEPEIWYHATVTYSNPIMTLYLNGEVGYQRSDVDCYNLAAEMFIGFSTDCGPKFGHIGSVRGLTVDDIRLYGRALNKNEVKLIYEKESQN